MASNDEVGTFFPGQPAPQSRVEGRGGEGRGGEGRGGEGRGGEGRGGEGRGGEGRGGEGNTKVCIYCTHHELITFL